MKIVLAGAGAAGNAIAKILHNYASPSLIVVDSKGILDPSRYGDLNEEKKMLLELSDAKEPGTLEDALIGADVFIGISVAGILKPEFIKGMNDKPIIFAIANPVPEIMPDLAYKAGAHIVATGRSDFPNQINNVLGFPGIFRGALDNGVAKITEEHKVAAAEALASMVKNPTPEKIIPGPFEPGIVETIAKTIV